MARLIDEAEVIISVCPPAAAAGVAGGIADGGFEGVYVDANAISAERSREIAGLFDSGQVGFVDGGIIGPPALVEGTTRLYLSGRHAEDVAALFAGSPLEAVTMVGEAGAASALKMSFASWTKGSSALLLAIRAMARAEGVETALLDEWAISQPGLTDRSERVAADVAPKGWRFAAEMEEIADTFDGVGLPDGFFRSAAELYQRLEPFKDRLDPPVSIDDVVNQLSP